MGIIERIRRTFGFLSEEEEKEIDKQDNDNPQAPPKEPQEKPAQSFNDHNILSFNSAASNRESASPNSNNFVKSKITTIEPKEFNDAQIVANCLRDKIPVIVNFEKTDIEEARRILYFISGTAYAVDGKVTQVSSKVFICAPNNVTVSSSEDDKKPGVKFLD